MVTIFLAVACLLLVARVTHTVQIAYQGGSGPTVVSNNSYTAGAENNIGDTFPMGTNTLIAFTADVSQQKSVFIMSSTDAGLKVNSTGASPLSLIGGQAVEWNSTNGQTNPFGAVDITALYLTNAAETVLTIKTLVDPTV